MRRLLCLFFLLLTFSHGAGAQTTTAPERPLITVSGQAVVNFTPDGTVLDSDGAIAIGQISITARVIVSFELK